MKLVDKKIQKVALVNPNYITKSITDKFTIPALGLEYIAANILDLVKVKIIDGKVADANERPIKGYNMTDEINHLVRGVI